VGIFLIDRRCGVLNIKVRLDLKEFMVGFKVGKFISKLPLN
jgi:hypothetical protein